MHYFYGDICLLQSPKKQSNWFICVLISPFWPTLKTVNYTLHTTHYSLQTARYTLNTAHYTLHNIHHTLHNAQCIMHTAPWYSKPNTLKTRLCIVHTEQHTAVSTQQTRQYSTQLPLRANNTAFTGSPQCLLPFLLLIYIWRYFFLPGNNNGKLCTMELLSSKGYGSLPVPIFSS